MLCPTMSRTNSAPVITFSVPTLQVSPVPSRGALVRSRTGTDSAGQASHFPIISNHGADGIDITYTTLTTATEMFDSLSRYLQFPPSYGAESTQFARLFRLLDERIYKRRYRRQ